MAQSEPEVVTINLEPFLMPVSILLSALILAFSIIHAGNTIGAGGGIVAGTNTGTGNTDTGNVAPTTAVVDIDDDAYLGNKDSAKVAIVEWTDYECPYCQRHHLETYPDIIKDYVESGKAIYVVRDYPLSFHDPKATDAAIASECVKELGGNSKFFSFIDQYFAATPGNGAGLAEGKMDEIISSVGVDKGKFSTCTSEKRYANEVKADLDEGTKAGISGTPGFVVGKLNSDGSVDGVIVSGAQPYASFQSTIDAQLAR